MLGFREDQTEVIRVERTRCAGQGAAAPPSTTSLPASGEVHMDGSHVMAESADANSNLHSEWEFSCELEVDYESKENASIVCAALAVDKELQPDKVQRQLSTSDGKLLIHFKAVEARFLRASFSAFIDILILATKTIEEFGGKMDS